MDFLISGSTHKVKKIILHSNVVSRNVDTLYHADSISQPGSPAFQRYMRCPWEIQGSPEDDDDGLLHPIDVMHELNCVHITDSPPHAKFYDTVR